MTKAAVLPAGKTETIVDPVCGMNVVPGKTKLVSVYNAHTYWFCTKNCREAFDKNPEKYVKKGKARRMGPFGRFLHRLAKANEEEFGQGGPSCCH